MKSPTTTGLLTREQWNEAVHECDLLASRNGHLIELAASLAVSGRDDAAGRLAREIERHDRQYRLAVEKLMLVKQAMQRAAAANVAPPPWYAWQAGELADADAAIVASGRLRAAIRRVATNARTGDELVPHAVVIAEAINSVARVGYPLRETNRQPPSWIRDISAPTIRELLTLLWGRDWVGELELAPLFRSRSGNLHEAVKTCIKRSNNTLCVLSLKQICPSYEVKRRLREGGGTRSKIIEARLVEIVGSGVGQK